MKMDSTAGPLETAREMVANRNDGRIKLHLTSKALGFRREHRKLFESGRYLPLTVEGTYKEHVCAFERSSNNSSVLVVVPRFCSRLIGDFDGLPLGAEVWQDTRMILSSDSASSRFRNIFTGEILHPDQQKGSFGLALQEILSVYPVALLERISDTGV
jgi:(1->4)-alpha-D-glucan 1-alpha-D-glucosylmutase